MKKKSNAPEKLVPEKAPENKIYITPIKMAEFIKEYHPEDGKAFVAECKKYPKENGLYKYDVPKVREWFIQKYYPDAYQEKHEKTKVEQFEDLLQELDK